MLKKLIKSNTNLNLETNNKYNSFKNGLNNKFVTVMQKK
jgi:hypothetical protein